MDQLTVLVASTLEEINAHGPAWDNIALCAPQGLPMLAFCWVSAFFECRLKPEQKWMCLLALDGTKLVGVLPLVFEKRGAVNGNDRYAETPFDWHTIGVDCLAANGREKEVLAAFTDYLCHRLQCDGLIFRHLVQDSPTLAAADQGLNEAVSIRRFDGNGSFIKVTGSFEEYIQTLDTKFVRNLRRLDRKMESLSDVRYSFVTDNSSVEENLHRFLTVECSCWKSRAGSAIIKSPELLHFYTQLAKNLARAGWLEWHFMIADDKTIAANMAIKFGRKLILLKIAYDEAYASYSPGNKLLERTIRRAFDSGEIDEINCLTEYAWNSNWKMELRPYYDLYIYANRPTALLTGYLPRKIHVFCENRPYLSKLSRILHKTDTEASRKAGKLRRVQETMEINE